MPVQVTTKVGCLTVAPAAVGVAGVQVVGTTTVPVVGVMPVQGPTLLLGNPNANDVLFRGPLVVSGLAFDPASTQGPGVDSVQFFIDSRDAGGTPIGSAVPGALTSDHPRVYTTTVRIPDNVSGGRTFVAYAKSSLTGQETVVSVPVFIGAAPSPTPR